MKKKVLFMLINMNVGGTEKAWLNMVTQMPREQYEITLLLLEEYGGFLESIPKDIKVTYISDYQQIKQIVHHPLHVTAWHSLKKGKIIQSLVLAGFSIIGKLTKDSTLLYQYLLRNEPLAEKEYDIAIAYAGPMDLISFFIARKIEAKRKFQWIHFDVTKIGFNRFFAAKVYREFERIYVVSHEGKARLDQLMPTLRYKTEVFPNVVSQEVVREMAIQGTGFGDPYDGMRILTVGRLSKEKGQDLAIRVLAQLKMVGFKVRWYCIGDGKERHEYEKLIEAHQLEDDFILLGTKINPYPFMKQCDIYVQPSRHEGSCITLTEARYLSKPIISTKFTGACEQIKQEETGLLTDFDEEQIYQAIICLITDEGLQRKLIRNLQLECVECSIKRNIEV
ncbi:hypothetical protein J14TS2_36870 [Bacillus sp. J14TS2]|uniref:glycosyltransferase n=1 Tax=Bacillus sp. J14TS2 TaxID=2807188 RepID=UPI001B198186|nr:glycosyltransferase [Bacillus sp. J14TS2]GIN73212.1 hypothetical protein J14TS2_36870 [Bacillus sp. J14TS2]